MKGMKQSQDQSTCTTTALKARNLPTQGEEIPQAPLPLILISLFRMSNATEDRWNKGNTTVHND